MKYPKRNGKKALVTGITGQDGSYLAELLLGKGYEVWGVIRRSSSFNTARIDHLYQDPHDADLRLRLVHGDLTDGSSINRVLKTARPDEIYNLGAQSHVKVSFDVPEYTGEVTGLGTIRVLEAMRDLGLNARFYQASSSELFGGIGNSPQDEDTPFHPRSPYGAAKAYAFWITKNYREAYGVFAANGILFNHECVTEETPVIIRRDGFVDIIPIEEIVPHRTDPRSGRKYTTIPSAPLDVWDRDRWTRVTCMTATWNPGTKEVVRIAARGAVFTATTDHVVFLQGPKETKAGDVRAHDSLTLSEMPDPTGSMEVSTSEAWLLGALCGDGWVSKGGMVRVTGNNESVLDEAERTWRVLTGGSGTRWTGKSGFSDRPVKAINLIGAADYGRYLRPQLYTESGEKRVPRRILNAGAEAQIAFLRGYNATDGLLAGHARYEFKSFKTTSPTLAAGLWWLAKVALRQRCILCLEDRADRTYIAINLSVPEAERRGRKGAHLRKPCEEVVKVTRRPHRGWLFDLATESGTFHAGIGEGWIHNSPRRGETFVTRKITRSVGKIRHGLQQKLYLGNLNAKRDWGYAPDYVDAMWRMLQAPQPDDFVVATGETHTVREFCEKAFEAGGMPLRWKGKGVHEKGVAGDGRTLVEIDPRYFRPAEVDLLLGNAAKARKALGWKPTTGFADLVRLMVEADLELARREKKADSPG